MTSERNIKKRSNPVDVDTDKEFEVGEMHVSKSVKIHGVMTSLSPMKPSASGTSKYFHGQLTDGKNEVRFVGFDAKVHEKLSDFHQKKEGIALSHCEVKEGKYSTELEVVVRRSTELHKSTKKFDVAASMFVVNDNLVMLEEIPRLSNYQRVSVRVKVMAEEEAIEVKKGLVKQEYAIADATASCKIVTWKDNIGVLQLGNSYKLSGLMVRMYNGKKYLSVPKDGFQILSIEDIGVVEDVGVEVAKERKLTNVGIVGIKFFEIYNGCYACMGKVTSHSDILGCCGRCGSTQRLDRCKEQTSAKLDVESEGDVIMLTAFSPVLDDICQGSASIDALLSCERFDLVYSVERNVMLSISR